MDAVNGKELWRFQTGAAISAAPITYTIDGEQYVAIFSGGTGIPYGNSVTEGDSPVGVQAGRQLQDRVGQQRGADACAADDPPPGQRRTPSKAAR